MDPQARGPQRLATLAGQLASDTEAQLVRSPTAGELPQSSTDLYSIALPEHLTESGPWNVHRCVEQRQRAANGPRPLPPARHAHSRALSPVACCRASISPYKLVSTYNPPDDHIRTCHDNWETSIARYPHVRPPAGRCVCSCPAQLRPSSLAWCCQHPADGGLVRPVARCTAGAHAGPAQARLQRQPRCLHLDHLLPGAQTADSSSSSHCWQHAPCPWPWPCQPAPCPSSAHPALPCHCRSAVLRRTSSGRRLQDLPGQRPAAAGAQAQIHGGAIRGQQPR